MNKPLVSIITPCYNAEKTIPRFIDSIIAQTYDNIELIVINDGSTDNSEQIIKEYEPKLTQKGYRLIYHFQENKGLGGAINAGLKLFTGDYLCWADADDYFEPTSIEDRVNFLEQNQQYAVVTSNAYVRNESNLSNARLLVKSVNSNTLNENQFEFMLNGDSIFCSGCHMVRSSAFLEVNPKREIFPARRGQNWQMLLPLYYKHKRYFLNKPLYNYIIYSNSMSNSDKNAGDLLLRYSEHEQILINTLKSIQNTQNISLDQYYSFVSDKYFKLKLKVAIEFKNTNLFNDEFVRKQEHVGIDFFDVLLKVMCKFPFLLRLLKKIEGEKYVEKYVYKKLNKSQKMYDKSPCTERVSIVVPCYNGEKFLDCCFDSILRQTYENIEVVIVNDGSSDKSEDIILSYREKVEAKGYIFKYIYQDNQGAAAAVNNALKHISGDFLMLYDVDDKLFNDCVKEKAQFLHNNPQYGMVRNNGYFSKNLSNFGKKIFVTSKKEMSNQHIFISLLKGETNNWAAAFMVRTCLLFESLSGNDIYVSRYGQNLQIMLPVAFVSKSGFINKPLMKYYIHPYSHSHSGDAVYAMERLCGYEGNRYGVLRQLKISDAEELEYRKIIERQYIKKRLMYSFLHMDRELFNQQLEKLDSNEFLYKFLWLCAKLKIFKIYHLIKRIVSILNGKFGFIFSELYFIRNNSRYYH